MTLVIWLIPILLAVAVFWTLRADTRISADQIWALAAAAPLVVALCAAGYSHMESRATLTQLPSAQQGAFITVQNGLQVVGLDLSPEEAACFERTLRTGTRAEWLTEGGPVPLNSHTELRGQLPPPELARHLAILGRLNCQPYVRVLADDGAAETAAASQAFP